MAKTKSIATLSVALVAKTTQFVKGMTQALGAVTALTTRGIKKLTGAILNLRTAIVGFVIHHFSKELIESLHHTERLSERLGISVERMRAFQRASRIAGIDTEVFSRATTRLVKAIGAAQEEGGKARKIFDELGLNVAELADLAPDELFIRIADALSTIPLAGRRLRLASELFGTRQAKVLNTALVVGGNFQHMLEETSRIQGRMSEMDLKRVGRLRERLIDLSLAVQGFFERVLADSSPIISALLKRWTDWIIALRDKFQGGFAERILFGAGDLIDFLLEGLSRVQLKIVQITHGILDTIRSIRDTIISTFQGAEQFLFGRTITQQPVSAPIDIVIAHLDEQITAITQRLKGFERGQGPASQFVRFLVGLGKDEDKSIFGAMRDNAKRILESFSESTIERLKSFAAAFTVGPFHALFEGLFGGGTLGVKKGKEKQESFGPLTGSAAQISLARTFIPGLSLSRLGRLQQVHDPVNDVILSTLRTIERNTRNGLAVQ